MRFAATLSALFLGGLTLIGLTGCDKDPAKHSGEKPAKTTAPFVPVKNDAPAPASAPLPVSPTECLTDAFGIPLKVVLTERGVRALDRAQGGNLVGEPLRFFWPYFTFQIHRVGDEAAALQIGDSPRKDSIRGWVPAAACVAWPTRLGGEYVPHFPLLIYKDREPLLETIKTGSTRAPPLARA